MPSVCLSMDSFTKLVRCGIHGDNAFQIVGLITGVEC